jgi:hypothetical protein
MRTDKFMPLQGQLREHKLDITASTGLFSAVQNLMVNDRYCVRLFNLF